MARGAGGLAAMLLAAMLVAAPAAAQLKPHMASYGAVLKNVPAGVEGSGSITVSTMLRCRSWHYGQSTSLVISAGGRPAVAMAIGLQGEEAADGRSMSYRSQTALNGQRSDIEGKGSAAGPGQAGRIEIVQDGVARTVALPDGAFFMVAGAARMLEELRAGRTPFKIRAFDPVSTQQVLEQGYSIVPSPFADTKLPADAGGLLAGRSWVVRSVGAVGGQTLETVLQVHESGVVSRVLQTVGGIAVEFTLQHLQPLPAVPC